MKMAARIGAGLQGPGSLLLVLFMCALAVAQGERSRPAVAVEAFLRAANSGNSQALELASRVVLQQRSQTLPLLVDGLSARSEQEILAVLRCLGSGDAREFFPQVAQLASHPRPQVRAELSRLAGASGTPLAQDVLLQAARDEQTEVRRRGFDGFLRLRLQGAQVLPLAVSGLLDQDPWIVGQAGRILSQWPAASGSQDPVVKILTPLVSRLTSLAAPAYFALMAERMGTAVTPLINEGLRHRTPSVVLAALKVVSQRRLQGALVAVRRLAQDPGRAGLAAVRCLGDLQDQGAVPGLVKLLGMDGQQRKRETLVVSLRRITGRTFGYDVRSWQRYVAAQH